MKMVAAVTVSSLILALAVTAPMPPDGRHYSAWAAVQNADQFLIVDCLLPGKIKQLGTQVTFVGQRQAVRTSASDCAIRGGEYTAYDRADYGTSLQVWMEPANGGDPKAQTYVGEIYEKQGDFASAAQWYQKAAAQGYAPAQIDLGSLYEQGKGVPKDPQQALNWYRKASGVQDLALQTQAPVVAPQQQNTPESNAETEKLKKENEALKKKLASQSSQVKKLQQQIQTLQGQLQQKQSKADDERQKVVVADTQINQQQADLEAQRKKLAAEQADLEKKKAQADQSKADELKKLADELKAQQQALTDRQNQLDDQKSELDKKKAEVAKLDAEVARLKDQAAQQQQKLADSSVQGPVIEILDPDVKVMRGLAVAETQPDTQKRPIVGRVTAAGGVLSLTVNDQAVDVDKKGMFRTQVPIAADGTKVAVVAVDQLGKRATFEFMLQPQTTRSTGGVAGGAPASDEPALPALNLDFGKYYALVIGNNNYGKLPKLTTPIADAEAIAGVLKDKYGFEVTLLKDANRYDILEALNQMREKLTEHDNLLIYYAGHGELDKVNQRGNWLPIDAEPNSSANWIPTYQVTDILNQMSARHVLIVADSCYSGTLTRSALTRLEAGKSPEAWANWVKVMVDKRSRTALTSGGVAPVLDAGAGNHSIFAKALLDALAKNDGVIEGQRLHQEIATSVAYAAGSFNVDQVPEYAPIKSAGHEAGDFFFVKR
ncbi:MAG TPA: caspase family protein [Candidatus Acidoferrum sp.]|nr:caspase family protein [Candidatus Acidoferrum sp.]